MVHFARDSDGCILVIDNGDLRILNFDSLYEQSCMRISRPYQLVHEHTQLMVMVFAFVEPRHIALFGLGGGSLLRTLHHVFSECHFTAIELRRSVVATAKQLFSLPGDHRVRLSVGNALREVAQMESECCDVIFSDMYDAYEIVQEQLQRTFLVECSRALTGNGWLVINLHDLPEDRSAFYELLDDIFPTVMLGHIDGNIILMTSNSRPDNIQINRIQVAEMEQLMQQRLMPLVRKLKPRDFKFNT